LLKGFADNIETLEDEDLPSTDEAFDIFAAEKAAADRANATRTTTQCFEFVPASLEAFPNFH
jgi:hypothetical protein